MYKPDKKPSHWTGHFETLEDRRVMSADPLSGFLGEPIVHHSFDETIVHHDVLEESPRIEHHLLPDADFWIDTNDPEYIAEEIDQIEQTLASAHNTTGLNNVVANYGFKGTGQTVAIIDSGIAYDHFALGGGFGANYRVVGGWDFTGENDADPYDDGPKGAHGTHVAGIVGGDAGADHGVAPGVDLVALRVFDDVGNGYFSWVENALRWVHFNRNNFENPITTVNLSLGVSSWNSTAIPSWTTLEDEFALLEADGIFVAVSAGNSYASFNAPGLGYPATSPYVVPVMSVTDGGVLASYSQRDVRAIAAPGSSIRSTVPDYKGNNNGITDDYAYFSGTSMASPYIAGASVLIREAMEFVGRTGITQDNIYDHMMSTGTAFVDAATGLTFKRLNLEAAINALIPADDYGSTAAAAFNLGNLTTTLSRNGLISTLSDVDYFKFTAGSNGTVTFAANNMTNSLEAAWTVSGATGTVSGSQGEIFSFDVVAGQTYTLGFSSSGGLGYYQLNAALEASSTFTYVDWGSVTYNQLNNLSVSGENWYRVAASQSGYMTVEGMFAAQGGQVNIQLYNANMQQISAGNAVNGTSRVDAYATAGQEFYICVQGTNSDVDYRLSNLVSVTGTTVNIQGTSGNDTFAFTAGNTHQITVNGVKHDFASIAVTNFVFKGGSGTDTIVATGTTGNETATMNPNQQSLVGAAYAVTTLSMETATFRGGGGADKVTFYDSATDDLYYTNPGQASMTGTGYVNAAQGFSQTFAFTSTGNDTAWIYDSAGDDLYRQWSTHFVSSGNNFYNYGRGFDVTWAYSSTGFDRAILYDSSGDDLLRAWSTHHVYSGVGFYNYIRGFEDVQAYATQGNDRAIFYDSAGDDQLKAWWDRAAMSGNGYFNYVRNFDSVEAYATTGNDRADFFDSSRDDLYKAWFDRVVMIGSNYFNYAKGFDATYAYASAGNDRAELYGSGGNDTIETGALAAAISGTGFYNYVQDFDNVLLPSAQSMTPAFLESLAGDNYDPAWPLQSTESAGTRALPNVRARFATQQETGTSDHVLFYDALGEDFPTAEPDGSAETTSSARAAASFAFVSKPTLEGRTESSYVQWYDSALEQDSNWIEPLLRR